MRLALLVGLAALVVGCGGERPRGVEVTAADDDAVLGRAPRPSAAFDTVYADSGLYADPRLRPDSLHADSLRRDSLTASASRFRQDSLRRAEAARPDFRTFWPAFQAAVRRDRAAVAALAAFSERFSRADFDGDLYAAAFAEGPFRDGALALSARDFRRDGTRRQASVVVGYDRDGRVVRQDEAAREEAVVLTFDVVDGAYRLVGVEPPGD